MQCWAVHVRSSDQGMVIERTHVSWYILALLTLMRIVCQMGDIQDADS